MFVLLDCFFYLLAVLVEDIKGLCWVNVIMYFAGTPLQRSG